MFKKLVCGFSLILAHPLMAAQNSLEKLDETERIHNFLTLQIEEETNSLEESIDEFLPELSKNPQYQNLLYTSCAYFHFCEDDLNSFKRASYYDTRFEPMFIANMQTAHKFVQLVSLLDTNHLTIDLLLQIFLTTRLDLINKRAISFRETQEFSRKYGKLPETYCIPTSPKKIDFLRRVAITDPESNASRDVEFATKAIERYQFLNLMIYQLYKLGNPLTLSSKTKRYISCSRTLWPILNDESTDLSYPDFACITEDHDSKEDQYHKDYDYYWANYDLIPHTVTLMNWGKQKTELLLTRLQILDGLNKEQVKALGWNPLSLPRPSWLYGVVPENVALSSGELSSKPAELSTFTPDSKLQEEPLKQIAYKKKNHHKKKESSRRGKQRSKLVPQIRYEESQSVRAAAAASSEVVSEEVSSHDDSTDNESIGSASDVITDIINNKIAGGEDIDSVEPKVDPLLAIPELSTPLTVTVKTLPEALLLPRGMRQFHSKVPVVVLEPAAETEKDWGPLVDTVFDYRLKGQGFNFGEFRTLWESINGKGTVRSSKSGGSHYALLNRQGKVVMGTFAHGDNHQYTKDTVRYLRAALNAVGVTPKQSLATTVRRSLATA